MNQIVTEEEEERTKRPEQPTPAESTEKKTEKKDTEAESELLIPEKALVRFMDVTVKPGFAYEYRIKVRMANPNYDKKNLAYSRLAKEKEIVASEWTPVPKV